MDHFSIFKASTREQDLLVSIARRTFSETFSSVNTEENMRMYLEKEFSPARLHDELLSSSSEYYLAALNNSVIGYFKLNYGDAQNEPLGNSAVEIERMYLLKEYHGTELGLKMLEEAIALSRRRNADFVWLGVWEHNARAIAFYTKNGFIKFDTRTFVLGEDLQNDLMMRRALQ